MTCSTQGPRDVLLEPVCGLTIAHLTPLESHLKASRYLGDRWGMQLPESCIPFLLKDAQWAWEGKSNPWLRRRRLTTSPPPSLPQTRNNISAQCVWRAPGFGVGVRWWVKNSSAISTLLTPLVFSCAHLEALPTPSPHHLFPGKRNVFKMQGNPKDSLPWDREHSGCYSHAFRETDSLRRTMQIVKCSLLRRRAQGRVSS